MLIPALIFVFVLACVACVAASGCLLFTQPVNTRPQVKIIPHTGPIDRGVEFKIFAEASDPDGGDVTLGWSTSPGDCTEPVDVSRRPPVIFMSPPGDPRFPFTFEPGKADSVCVFVIATDAQGATAVAAQTFSTQNRPPVAVIQVLEPTTRAPGGFYPLYSVFKLSAATSHDPDGDTVVDADFQVLDFPQKAMPTPKIVPCPSAQPTSFLGCLDVGGWAGAYQVTLTVGDGSPKRSDPAMVTLMVDNDHPACVSEAVPDPATSPLILAPSEAKTFAITQILDDGAPLPAPADGAHAAPTFAWKVRRNAGAWQTIAGYETVNALTLPASTYATGDVVDVSVTISDGVDMHLQTTCDPGCPDGCPQSAQWTVAYR